MIIPTFLKWAGGKRRLIEKLDPYILDRTGGKINTYYEPFLGGASMFFYIKQKYSPKHCVLSDINEDLIETFKVVRDSPKKLMKEIKRFKSKDSKEFYYKIRDDFNDKKITGIKRSAAFIYMNKTCFNGLWRVNSKNKFNVPYGNYKNPGIFNEEKIMFASKLLQGVDIIKQDYMEILKTVKLGDFIYLDPCYDPLKKTSFANYNPKRFNEEDRLRMAKFANQLAIKNVEFALSNNKIPEMIKLYPKKLFSINEILAPRFINANVSGRGEIIELVITKK